MEVEQYMNHNAFGHNQCGQFQIDLDSGSQYPSRSSLSEYLDENSQQQHQVQSDTYAQYSNSYAYSNNQYQTLSNNAISYDQQSQSSSSQFIAKPFLILDRNSSNTSDYVERPIKEDRFFHLPGDILIEINEGDPFEFSDRQKQILSLEKNSYCTILNLQSVQFCTNFKYVNYLLDRSQNQKKHLLSQRVKKYQVIAQGFNFLIKHLKKTYEQDLEKLNSILLKREAYKQQFIQDYLRKNFKTQDYFMLGVNGIDLNQENICIKNVQLSNPLLELMGLKQDKIGYFCLRSGGILDYCNQITRQQIFDVFLDNFTKMRKGEQVLMKEVHITTLDGFTIIVEVVLQNIFCQFPPELQYHTAHQIPSEIEAIFIGNVKINQSHIKHLATLREQLLHEHQQMKKHSQLNHFGREDIQYALETQMFMERFYPKVYQQYEQTSEKEANEERQMQRGECGYRVIR